jgi:hypothetical protein
VERDAAASDQFKASGGIERLAFAQPTGWLLPNTPWRPYFVRMATGIFRTSHDWAEVDFGIDTMAITRRDYEAGRYQPPFDELPLEGDYRAAQKRAAMARLPRDLA